MELGQLRAALAVADHGSFTKAAAAVHLSQPALSHAVAKLEAELGVTLFDRLGRGAALTAAGEAFEAIARDTLRDAERLTTTMAEIAGAVSGRLQLAAPRTLVRRMAGLVGCFRTRHPGVVVELSDTEGDDEALECVSKGRCDMALLRLVDPPAPFLCTPLTVEEFVAVFPPGTVVGSTTLSLKKLTRYPLIAPPRGSRNRKMFDLLFSSHGVDVEVMVESAHPESILELVWAGAGVGLASRDAATTFVERGVVATRLDPRIVQQVYLVHRAGRLSPAATAFEAVAREFRTSEAAGPSAAAGMASSPSESS
jgi:DNA-binding transcriptional LysR family regulator